MLGVLCLVLCLGKITQPTTLEQATATISRAFFETFRAGCMVFLRNDNTTLQHDKNYRLSKMLVDGLFWSTVSSRAVTDLATSQDPTCRNALHIINGYDTEMLKDLRKLKRLYPASKSSWLVFLDSSLPDFFEAFPLTFNILVIAVRIINLDRAEFFEAYRVDKEFPVRIKRFGSWTSESGLDIVETNIYERRSDLEGKVLVTGSTENWPMTSFQGLLDKSIPWDGFYARVWMELEKLMNFTSIHKRSLEVGIQVSKGNFNGLVGMLIRGEIDVIVSELLISTERLDYLDFAFPLVSSTYQVFFRQPGFSVQWAAVFRPFQKDVWLAVVTWIIGGSLCLSFCYYVSLLYGFEAQLSEMHSPSQAFFFILQSLCQQGSPTVPLSVACRLLFLVCYLVSAVLIPSYSASLISSLTYHTPYRPFDSFEEMLIDGKYKLFVESDTAEYSFFANATDETLKQVFERLMSTIPPARDDNESYLSVDTICDHRYHAIFGVRKIFESKMLTKRRQDCHILTFSRPISRVHESLALIKGHQFGKLIDYHIHKMSEKGILERLATVVWPHKEKNKKSYWNPVEVRDMLQIFVFLCCGMSTSFTFFLLEKYLSKLLNRTIVKTF